MNLLSSQDILTLILNILVLILLMDKRLSFIISPTKEIVIPVFPVYGVIFTLSYPNFEGIIAYTVIAVFKVYSDYLKYAYKEDFQRKQEDLTLTLPEEKKRGTQTFIDFLISNKYIFQILHLSFPLLAFPVQYLPKLSFKFMWLSGYILFIVFFTFLDESPKFPSLTKVMAYISMHGIAISLALLVPDILRNIFWLLGIATVGLQLGLNPLTSLKSDVINTLEAMISALEHKDIYTHQHSFRVSKFAGILAKHVNPSEEFVQKIIRAGKIHDLGKLLISDKLLNKPSRLTPEEYEIMKKHTIYLEELLGELKPFFKDELEIAMSHHERWDGTGYPRNLKGEEIPLGGRILAIVDTFDALITDRAYKRGVSTRKALEILKEESGKAFDPKLIELFIKVIDTEEIIEVVREYKTRLREYQIKMLKTLEEALDLIGFPSTSPPDINLHIKTPSSLKMRTNLSKVSLGKLPHSQQAKISREKIAQLKEKLSKLKQRKLTNPNHDKGEGKSDSKLRGVEDES